MTQFRRFISFFVLGAILMNNAFFNVVSAANTPIPRNGLIWEWMLDGNANDTSGSGSNGVATNVTWENTNFKGQKSARFNGTNSTISLPNAAWLSGNSARSIFAWVKLADLTADNKYHTIFGNGANATGNDFSLSLYKASGWLLDQQIVLFARRYYDDQASENIRAKLSTSSWALVWVTYNGVSTGTGNLWSGIRFWLNGDEINRTSTPDFRPDRTFSTVQSGVSIWYTPLFAGSYSGSLQSVRVYNRALSAQEVQTIYQESVIIPQTCTDGIKNQDETSIDVGGVCGPAFSPNPNIPRTNLAAEYMFNANTLIDTSGNNNSVQWVGMSYGYDGSGAINYASFSGTSSQVWGLLWWSTDPYWAYGISLWVKFDETTIPASTNCWWWINWLPSREIYNSTNNACESSSYNFHASVWRYIFDTKRVGGPLTDVSLYISSNKMCYFNDGVIYGPITQRGFDCTSLLDQKWHNVILQKDDYRTLKVYIDGKIMASFPNDQTTFGRTISLGKSPMYGNDVGFIGKMWAVRIFKTQLSSQDIFNLSNEYSLLLPTASTSVPTITINNPDTNSAPSKVLTASTNTGTLQMSITTGTICNSSLTYDNYSPMTFNSVSNNGTRICYKATNGANITYALSNSLAGITGQSSAVNIESIFDENAYKAWASSSVIRPDDFTYSILGAMTGKDNTNYINFVDINGDGLVDVLYNYNGYRSILSNTGDYNFKPSYKCKTANSLYYGDCANKNYQ